MGNIAREDLNPYVGEAAKNMSAFQYYFVKLNTGGQVTSVAAATDLVLGVLRNEDADATGKAVIVDQRGSILCKAGTTSGKPGDQLTIDASGKVTKHTAGTGTRQNVVGMALEDYSTGAIFAVQIPTPFHRGEA